MLQDMCHVWHADRDTSAITLLMNHDSWIMIRLMFWLPFDPTDSACEIHWFLSRCVLTRLLCCLQALVIMTTVPYGLHQLNVRYGFQYMEKSSSLRSVQSV